MGVGRRKGVVVLVLLLACSHHHHLWIAKVPVVQCVDSVTWSNWRAAVGWVPFVPAMTTQKEGIGGPFFLFGTRCKCNLFLTFCGVNNHHDTTVNPAARALGALRWIFWMNLRKMKHFWHTLSKSKNRPLPGVCFGRVLYFICTVGCKCITRSSGRWNTGNICAIALRPSTAPSPTSTMRS